MRQLISFVHISLDGFVAGPNGEMNWITINDEIFTHVEKRIQLGNTAMYGRATFEMMENYWPGAGDKPDASRHDKSHSKWYLESHKIVLSRTLKESEFSNTTIISDHLADSVNKIKAASDKNSSEILVFGSPGATHSLFQHNLIDGFWLFVNPVVLGNGIPLFKHIKQKLDLDLIRTHTFNCGVTELCYAVKS